MRSRRVELVEDEEEKVEAGEVEKELGRIEMPNRYLSLTMFLSWENYLTVCFIHIQRWRIII